MIEVLTAIQTKFNATAALTATFPNGCYLSLAPRNEPLPVCVLTVVSAVPQYNTGKDVLNVVTVQFSVYATTDTQALTSIKDIRAAFDESTLTLATEQGVRVQRVNEGLTRDDESTWHALVVYQVWVGETLP